MNEPRIADIAGYLSRPSEPELELLRLYSPWQALTIFDVGACEGEDSIRYAKRFPNARIYAFEPLPTNQRLIQANFEKYHVTNAELVPVALSDQCGPAEFFVSAGRPDVPFCGEDWNYGNKSSSLLPPAMREPMHGWITFPETVRVPCETVHRFCKSRGISRVDFMHMDVQGAEFRVLAGAGPTLKRVVAIWLEVAEQVLYQGQWLRPEMETYLRKHGFALATQLRRNVEGDQFYDNIRFPRVWRHLASRRAEQGYRRLRSTTARLKNLCFPRRPGHLSE
jgi:FkbM family methyltransferase